MQEEGTADPSRCGTRGDSVALDRPGDEIERKAQVSAEQTACRDLSYKNRRNSDPSR
jgi:hypothetical protein